MMKLRKFPPLILFFLIFNQAFSQNGWRNIGAGTNFPVKALVADTANNQLYAAGSYAIAADPLNTGIAKWDGNNWSSVGSGISSGSEIASLLLFKGALVAGGTFTNIGGVAAKNIALWDGSDWFPLDSGLEYTGATTISTLIEFNSELYAGGTFSGSGGTVLNYIAKWDGSKWQPLGSGTNGKVTALSVYNNELYVGGTFTEAGGVAVKNVAKWNGMAWSDVGGGLDYTGATTVSTFRVFQGALYAGGTFTQAGNIAVKNIAKWDGTQWSDPGGGASYTGTTTISTLIAYRNLLIAGGTFDHVGNGIEANYLAAWDGVNWSSITSAINGSVLTLAALGETLFAGGIFTNAAADSPSFILQFSASSPQAPILPPQGSNGANPKQRFRIYPNPVENRFALDAIENKTDFAGHNFDVIIYDAFRNEILRVENVAPGQFIDRNGIPQGIYMYRIVENGIIIQDGKISFR